METSEWKNMGKDLLTAVQGYLLPSPANTTHLRQLSTHSGAHSTAHAAGAHAGVHASHSTTHGNVHHPRDSTRKVVSFVSQHGNSKNSQDYVVRDAKSHFTVYLPPYQHTVDKVL